MIIDLSEIEDSRLTFEFSLRPEEFDLDTPGLKLTGDVQIAGELVRRTAQTDMRGRISGEAEIECTRCLRPVSQTLQTEFDISFVDAENFSNAREHEVAAEDLDTDVLESDRIDLREVAREQILLNLPQQVLCDAACRGICPKCGADRNSVDCKCEEKEIDPRWAALKNLK